MSFQNVLVNLICSLHIIMFYKRFILYIRTHTKITIIIFFWNFGIELETKNLFLCFYLLIKLITFIPAIMTKPLFAQNVLELVLILCIVFFIADIFSWVLVERFQSTEVRQFCIRLQIQTLYQKKCQNHYHSCCSCWFLCMKMKLKCKTYLSNIPLNCKKFQTIF